MSPLNVNTEINEQERIVSVCQVYENLNRCPQMHQVTKYSNYSKDFEKFYTGSGINTWRFGNTTVSGTVGVGNLSVEHRAFAVETYFKNNDPVILTQRICLRHFNIHRNDSVPSRNTLLLWARNFRETASAAKWKPPGREPAIRTP